MQDAHLLKSQLLTPTAIPFASLRQRHTKQKGGLVDVMVLIAVISQGLVLDVEGDNQSIPENANTAGLEHRR